MIYECRFCGKNSPGFNCLCNKEDGNLWTKQERKKSKVERRIEKNKDRINDSESLKTKLISWGNLDIYEGVNT